MHETRPKIRRRPWVAFAVVAPMVLVACGDDGEDESATGDTTTTAADTPPTTAGGTVDDTSATDDTSTTDDTATTAPVEAGAVLVAGYAFDPTPVTVQAGDTVTWTNDDDFPHTTTSDEDVWDSDPIEPGASFSFTFEEPGTYPYLCAIHNFMQGEVVVE